MPPQEESSLDRLQKRIYSKDAVTPAVQHGSGPAPLRDAPHAWENAPIPMAPKKKKRSFAALFFIGCLLFFAAAAAIAAYLLLSSSRSVSTDNITLSTAGSPTTVAAGDTVPISLVIENKNPVELTDANLAITFPDGTRSSDDVTQPYPAYNEPFDSIASGAHIERTVKAVVFGEEGQVITLPVTLTYHTVGSNSAFVKQATYQFTISTAPITLSVAALDQTVSGQPITLSVSVRSNATTPIQGAVLQADYPFGFVQTNATLPGTNGVFSLGTLEPGASKDLKITGTLTGEDGGQRVFTFTAGTADASGALSVAYTKKQTNVAIAAPFLNVLVAINGSDADGAVVSPGQQVHANVTWKNTLANAVNDAKIRVVLSGAVDPKSVTADRGFYQSSDQSIVFDRDTDPSLAALAPGASGVGSFTFTVPENAGGSSKGSSVGIVVSIAGNRTDESNVPQQVSASQSMTVKVAGAFAIATSASHLAGPVPPTPGQKTTYTVTWRASAGSSVGGAKATATLPSYATFVSSGAAGLTYDDSTRKVTWSLGDLSAGASPSVAFQVSILPSVSQVGSSPTLVSGPVLTGYDRFAQTNLTFTGGAATTETPGDPGYSPGDGDVQ